MARLIDYESTKSDETCCGPNPAAVVWSMSQFLLIVLFIAGILQLLMYKKRGTLVSKICKYVLYFGAAFFTLIFLGVLAEYDSDRNYQVYYGLYYDYFPIAWAIILGIIFSSCVLVTHYLSQDKKNWKPLLWKVLATMIIFQVIAQLEMRFNLLDWFPNI